MAWFALVLLVAPLAVRGTSATAPEPVVAFLGDSLTAGLHASRPDLTYRELVTQRLAETPDAGRTVTVVQHPMGLLDDAQRRLPQVLAARPSLVFVELGHHEVWADAPQLELFESRYADILDTLLASGAEVIPSTLAWLGYAPESVQYAAARRINAIIRRLAADRELVVADLWSRTHLRLDLISTPADPSFVEPYQGDDLHPNDAGHQALAEGFWRAYRMLRTRPLLGQRISV
jgi:lysophospholipase L1-like esterase